MAATASIDAIEWLRKQVEAARDGLRTVIPSGFARERSGLCLSRGVPAPNRTRPPQDRRSRVKRASPSATGAWTR